MQRFPAPPGVTVYAAFLLGLALAGCDEAAPAPAPTPADSVRRLATGLGAGGRPEVLWTALPDSLKAGLRDAVQRAAAVVPAPVHEKAFTALRQAGIVLKTQAEHLAAHGLVRVFAGGADEAELEAGLTTLGDLLLLIGKSPLSTPAGLASSDPGRFLATTGAELWQGVVRLARVSGRDLPAELAAIEVFDAGVVEGDRAAVVVQRPRGEPALLRIELRRLDGRWVPVPLLDAWERLRAEIDALERAVAEPGGQPFFVALEDCLDQLIAALERLRAASGSAELAAMLQREFVRLAPAWRRLAAPR